MRAGRAGEIANSGTVGNSGTLGNTIPTSLFSNTGSITNGGTFVNHGTFTSTLTVGLFITNGGTFDNFGTATISGSCLSLNGYVCGFTSRGMVTNESGAGFNVGTYVETENTFDNSGSLTETSGGFFLNQYSNALAYPGHFTNDGTVTIGFGASFNGSSVNVVTNDAGATITVNSGGVFTGVANYFNSGMINNNGGQLDISAAGDVINQTGGTITSSGSFELDGTLDNSSTVTIKTGGSLTITSISAGIHGTINNAAGASIDNSGAVDNAGDVENAGTITDECLATFTNEAGSTYNGNAVANGCVGGQSQIDCQSLGGTFALLGTSGALWSCTHWFNNSPTAVTTLQADCHTDIVAAGFTTGSFGPVTSDITQGTSYCTETG